MHDYDMTVCGYPLHCVEAGAGPVVLLLHGFARSSDDWRAGLQRLSGAGYRAIAVDYLGFGRSAKPADAPHSLQLGTQLYSGLLDALAIPRCTLVAHSMGGKYALATALLHPQRVERLALVATDGFTEASPLTRLGGWPLIGDALLWVAARPRVLRALLSSSFYEPARFVDDALIARERAALRDPATRRALMALSRRYDATDLGLSGLRGRLGELRQPCLLVWGAEDRVFPPEPYSQRAAASIPGARLAIFPRCGHFPQIEAERSFYGLLLGFLAQA